MLQITIKNIEYYDNTNNQFYTLNDTTLSLEHSLVSISKWETKWHKPFISKDPKTYEETIDYIKCMTITQNVNPIVYNFLTNDNINSINEYIQDDMTATKFYNGNPSSSRPNRETITSELIYYWMIALNIPFECQKWHLNRLLTLIRLCNIKNNPGKKYSKKELLSNNAKLNAERKKKFGTSG